LDGKYSRLEYFKTLWWGQRIPAYYYGKGKEDYVVALDEKALECRSKKVEMPV